MELCEYRPHGPGEPSDAAGAAEGAAGARGRPRRPRRSARAETCARARRRGISSRIRDRGGRAAARAVRARVPVAGAARRQAPVAGLAALRARAVGRPSSRRRRPATQRAAVGRADGRLPVALPDPPDAARRDVPLVEPVRPRRDPAVLEPADGSVLDLQPAAVDPAAELRDRRRRGAQAVGGRLRHLPARARAEARLPAGAARGRLLQLQRDQHRVADARDAAGGGGAAAVDAVARRADLPAAGDAARWWGWRSRRPSGSAAGIRGCRCT